MECKGMSPFYQQNQAAHEPLFYDTNQRFEKTDKKQRLTGLKYVSI